MSTITVEVTINKGVATYGSSSKQVAPDGTITIDAGDNATINFVPASGQSWQFQSPWVSIMSNTPGIQDVSLTSGATQQVSLDDNNPQNTEPSNYTYTLSTTMGLLDPAILNKGRR